MKKKILIISTIAILYLMLKKEPNIKLKPLVKNQKIRGNDTFGSGVFGASRGNRTHEGIDIITVDKEDILSPITGTFTRIAHPYSDDLSYKGMVLKNSTYEIKIFYINPTIPVNTKVEAGQKIAIAQNIAKKFGTGMINHLHLEVRKNGILINPTNLF